jgi:uncharacterized membrane protein
MDSQRGLDRVVNLSDAVVAIAATLLVLPLVDIASSVGDESLPDLLAENADQLLAFALSFAVICRFWLLHHALFTRLVGFTTPMLWVNFAWLLSIAFLPFPTALVSFAGATDAAVSGLYIGTMLVTTAAGTAQQWLASRSPRLLAPGVDALRLRASLIATATMALMLLIAVIVPPIGLWALFLLVPSGLLEAWLTRRDKRPGAPHGRGPSPIS